MSNCTCQWYIFVVATGVQQTFATLVFRLKPHSRISIKRLHLSDETLIMHKMMFLRTAESIRLVRVCKYFDAVALCPNPQHQHLKDRVLILGPASHEVPEKIAKFGCLQI